MIQVIVINDYLIIILVIDVVEGGFIVVYYLDGVFMLCCDKGLLWVVYLFDSDVKFCIEMIYLCSIWQFNKFEIIE